MPTYEYECEKCGDRFEAFQKMSDKSKTRCTKCRGRLTRLVTGGTGFIFKGSGFYVTDSRKGRDKAERRDKPEKSEKPEKPEKKEKSEKPEKTEKGGDKPKGKEKSADG